MPEEAQQAPEQTQDTPVQTEQVEPSQDTESVNWQERYENLQPEFTRTTQEKAQLEELVNALQSDDPELRAAAAEAIGFELPDDDDDDDDWEDPDERRIAQLEQTQQQLAEWAQEREENQNLEQYYEYVDDKLDEVVAPKLGYDLTDDDIRDIVGAAERLGNDKGLPEPDWDGAVSWFQARENAIVERYKTTKRAPFVPSGGQPGSEKFDFNNEEERINRMAAIIDANRDD